MGETPASLASYFEDDDPEDTPERLVINLYKEDVKYLKAVNSLWRFRKIESMSGTYHIDPGMITPLLTQWAEETDYLTELDRMGIILEAFQGTINTWLTNRPKQ